MAETKVQEAEVNETLVKAKSFWEKYKKFIIGFAAGVIIAGGGWYIYKKMFKEPAEEKAADAIFKAEQYFNAGSWDSTLNGDGQNKGVLYVIKSHSGTKSANLAHFYAGVSYLHKGDYNNAVKYLKDFDTDAKQIQMLAYGRLGDAYSELGKKEDAVDNYKKAGSHFEDDEINSSEFLFRAGYLLESMGKTKEAVEVYKDLKERFPRTEKGFTVDKYIYRLSVEKNEFSVK
jgi:tetratricopeptide (TPR) repeat protein